MDENEKGSEFDFNFNMIFITITRKSWIYCLPLKGKLRRPLKQKSHEIKIFFNAWQTTFFCVQTEIRFDVILSFYNFYCHTKIVSIQSGMPLVVIYIKYRAAHNKFQSNLFRSKLSFISIKSLRILCLFRPFSSNRIE